MATILLSAAGNAIGGAIGGSVAGMASASLGKAVGATIGKVLDQRLLGGGAEAVETGKVDRFRLTRAGEGASIASVFGRVRVGGQVIWASDFVETATTTGGGKGSPAQPRTTRYSYSVSLAIALCEGEIATVGRVWADGEEIAPADLNMRVYRGTHDQLPDPVMEAVEGAGQVPAYRGTAYVVIENLALEAFGNRVPQFSFEVVRAEQPGLPEYQDRLGEIVKAVALMPGTGEYALATTQVNYSDGPGSFWAANSNSPSGKSDFVTSMDALEGEVPGCGAASLIVSWFGDDLRCGECAIRPKVERAGIDGINMAWTAGGQTRATAQEIARVDDRPIYGGTPADASVVEAIRHMRERGQRVMFYPFILMEQMAGNGLPDPWSDAEDQPALPWRGRITLSEAPGRDASPDGTGIADLEVAAFFGTASASDFQVSDGIIQYSGPEEWGMRRFILHYAALCAAAGGVDAFCIGSEMRGLTQIRGANGFPAVAAMRTLAADVRSLLGPDVKIGYAADWSEYFGYQPQDGSGDRYFHLDPLWADDNIDFIGIDNYMPLSDWRDGPGHLDHAKGARSIYDLDYLGSNVEGGEGFDWCYRSREAAEAQIRTPIVDEAHGEHWIWRYKDLRSWWENDHHERIGGIRQAEPTEWIPRSKPFWFTELGCAAIDKGTNQPNKFLDPKSSESSVPRYSNGLRDDLIQRQYLRAVLGHWSHSENNPVSPEYGGAMVDLSNAFVWAWDTRPFPAFPNNRRPWDDGANYARGHWLNGRSGSRSLSSVVAELCHRSGVTAIDTTNLRGVVRGYHVEDMGDARAALQPLMLRYGFDAIERDGMLVFRMRDGGDPVPLDAGKLALHPDLEGDVERRRESAAEMAGRVRLRFVQADADHDVLSEEAVLPDDRTHSVATSEVALSLSRAEARQTVERWLSEARISRDTLRLALPPSAMALGAGDVVTLAEQNEALYRIDRVEQGEMQLLEAVRIEPSVYHPAEMPDDAPGYRPFVAPTPVYPVFLDLPLLTGEETPHAPYLAVTAQPWPGSVSVFSSLSGEDYGFDAVVDRRAVIGVTETPLLKAQVGVWDRGPDLQVKLTGGALETKSRDSILNGANLAAIGDGSSGCWELFQFTEAELIGPSTYLLRGRLRGQLGSDAFMPEAWPEGSVFVLIDDAVQQLESPGSQRRLARHFLIGPSSRGYDDPSFVHLTEAFDGNGLRPYSPVHLAAKVNGGDLRISWIRRTRIDGDDWTGLDVPLAEEREHYLVRVVSKDRVLREVDVASPDWTYTANMHAEDSATGPIEIHVAQVSARFGPGAFSKLPVGV
ncbi:glycoside hydrolase/phage tail family protein [Lutimaribacter marinistellae]|uniref:Glycoside hydrolase/phage tail family protein n=1 Tax=Lutimaribacter marinistellae TaxID=1820329 RepID=A0ABV7THC5_9RHOB